jgi:hypothetical protein
MLLGYKETTMNLKNILTKIVVKEAAGKIMPMADAPKPALGWKARLAAALAIIGAAATALAQYLGS